MPGRARLPETAHQSCPPPPPGPACTRSHRARACLQVYLVILTVRVLLSWFRNINWYGEPFNTLRQVRRRRRQS